jgi:DNA-binding ferritin-like protein
VLATKTLSAHWNIHGAYFSELHTLDDIQYVRLYANHCSEEYKDEGTFSLLVSVIRLHEKMVWML